MKKFHLEISKFADTVFQEYERLKKLESSKLVVIRHQSYRINPGTNLCDMVEIDHACDNIKDIECAIHEILKPTQLAVDDYDGMVERFNNELHGIKSKWWYKLFTFFSH